MSDKCPKCGAARHADGGGYSCGTIKYPPSWEWEDSQSDKCRIAELQAESAKLRAALAVSKDPCVYCQLPKEEMSKCQAGFPGCGRMDDLMGCPEFGASLNAEQLQAENAQLKRELNDRRETIAKLRSVLKAFREANEDARKEQT